MHDSLYRKGGIRLEKGHLLQVHLIKKQGGVLVCKHGAGGSITIVLQLNEGKRGERRQRKMGRWEEGRCKGKKATKGCERFCPADCCS